MAQVMVVGSDGRTHAVVWKLAQSPHLKNGTIYVVPGNAGTARIPRVQNCLHADLLPQGTARESYVPMAIFARSCGIDLVVFCEEKDLIAGAADVLRHYGVTVFGPGAQGASLEALKSIFKGLARMGGIPIPADKTVRTEEEALEYLKSKPEYPLYIKADQSLADRSLNVTRAETIFDAKRALHQLLGSDRMRQAVRKVIIESFAEGPEASLHAVVDNLGFIDPWPISQDHKQLYPPGSVPWIQNPNTGGMGALAPVPWMTASDVAHLHREITEKLIRVFQVRGGRFEGCIYPGIKGKKALESNVRFGSPECQVYMRLFEGDIFEYLLYAATGRLRERPSRWSNRYAVCVMIASEGYGIGSIQENMPVDGIARAEEIPEVVVFHGGTWEHDGVVYTGAAGRPIAVTAVGDTLRQALERVYLGVSRIWFKGMQYRTDIGAEALELAGL